MKSYLFKTNQLFQFLLILFSTTLLTILVSCGGGDDDDDDDDTMECTFESDPECFCEENPEDEQCEACTAETTFEEDAECFCENNPSDEQCMALDPIAFCMANPDSGPCTSVIRGGDFETNQDTIGVIGEDGNAGSGQWFFPGPNTRATYEIIDASTEDAFGEKALKVEIIQEQANHYNIQVVNTEDTIPTGKRYILLVKIKPDAAGRRVEIAGGVDGGRTEFNYWNFTGSGEHVLEAGWNEIGIYIQPPTDPEPDAYPDYEPEMVDHVRAIISFAYSADNPVGSTFIIDDFKVIEVGDRVEFLDAPAVYCMLYPGSEGCE